MHTEQCRQSAALPAPRVPVDEDVRAHTGPLETSRGVLTAASIGLAFWVSAALLYF